MKRVDVILIGAGSTGLVMAKQLELAGFQVLIIEKRTERGTHSRAIGIHPPGLRILKHIGILEEFLSRGTSVTRGLAHVGSVQVGSISLASGLESHDRVLTIPQFQTEEILEHSLEHATLLRGWTLTALHQYSSGVQIEITSGDLIDRYECAVLIGADGMHSTVRRLTEIKWIGRTYPFRYAMADVADNTDFGNDAAIFLNTEGLTESFPLPGGIRRWVVNHQFNSINVDRFFEIIQKRTRLFPDIKTQSMFSEFEIHQYRAEKMYHGHVFLVGDALGVMSPIGGQAMSLHWVQSAEIVELLTVHRDRLKSNVGRIPADQLDELQKKHLRRLRLFSRRSHFNTRMGLPGTPNWLLKGISGILLSPGIQNYWSKRFSMRDLR